LEEEEEWEGEEEKEEDGERERRRRNGRRRGNEGFEVTSLPLLPAKHVLPSLVETLYGI